jgi:uncharacterized repeat protein (TIGR01451 family)
VRPTAFGQLSNHVSVVAAELDHTPENNSAVALTQVGVANLSVAISDSPDPVMAGQPLTFVVTVVNLGPDPALAAVVSFFVDQGFCAQSATVSQGTLAGGGQSFEGAL